MKLLKVFMVAGIFLAGMVGTSFASPVQWAGNGHWYDVVISDISWENARVDAVNKGGYLASITSAGEQLFIQSLAVTVNTAGDTGLKLGGFQLPADARPADASWQWVSGEAWTSSTYTNWAGGEPNDTGGDESYLYLDERFTWSWNDYNNEDKFYNPKGYIVEFDSNPVPEPSTLLLLGAGLGGFALWRRKKS